MKKNKTKKNITKKSNLSRKKRLTIPIMLGAKTIDAGVKKAGISRSTFYEWLKGHEFKAELARQRSEMVDFAMHELKASAGEAVKVLKMLLKAKSERVRLRTALGILDRVNKFIDQEDIEKRLHQLEKNLEQQKNRHPY